MTNYVFVSAYYRIRFGKIEYVRAHWRSAPDTGGLAALVAPLNSGVA